MAREAKKENLIKYNGTEYNKRDFITRTVVTLIEYTVGDTNNLSTDGLHNFVSDVELTRKEIEEKAKSEFGIEPNNLIVGMKSHHTTMGIPIEEFKKIAIIM